MPTHTQVELQCGKCLREQLLKCFKILVVLSIILKLEKGQAGLESCPADFAHSVQTLLRCLIRMLVKSHLEDCEHQSTYTIKKLSTSLSIMMLGP